MNKWMLASGLLLAAALVATGCGGGKSDSVSSPAASQTAAGGSAKAITIHAKNFEFDQKEIRVKKGETVTITLNSTQGIHGMKIEGYNQEINNGKSVTFTADKAGEFKFACSVMCGTGHADMVGKLIVE